MNRLTSALAMALLVLIPTLVTSAEMSQGRLTVSGEGRVASAPDMATITLGVTFEAETAAEALAATSTASASILEQIAQSGVAPEDIQTRDLSLQPVWNQYKSEAPQISAFRAGNTISVRVRALGDLGSILDGVVEIGANRFHGLSFGLQNPGPVHDAARNAAVADAMRKARLYAEAAGLTLGPVIELSETGHGSPQPVMMETARVMSSSVPVASGEVSTNARVTMVFAIEP